MSAPRVFSSSTAVRARVPLLVGLTAPSSGGKTKSALRLADGMRRVDGGRTFLIDTEANRALHYAADHDFQHVPFGAPFSPADYLAAVDHCMSKGATVIIIDSVSHEWEGAGGVLDMHDQELTRIAGNDHIKREKNTMRAWGPAKRAHGLLVRTLLQTPAHFILCYRAKPKLKIKKGKAPEERGYMPIGGEDLVFELGVNCLLLPGARGVPTWSSEEEGERFTMKRPDWAEPILRNGVALDEDAGARLAQWAAGSVRRSIIEILEDLERCTDPATLGSLKTEMRIARPTASKEQWEKLLESGAAAQARIKRAAELPEPDVSAGEVAAEDEPA